MRVAERLTTSDLILRPPRKTEWTACQMLLPEVFQLRRDFTFRLAVLRHSPRILGAIAFRQGGDITYGLRLRVVRTDRRQGVGSLLLTNLIDDARRLGHRTLLGPVYPFSEPQAEPFLAAHGFERTNRLTTLEADIRQMRHKLAKLKDRLQSHQIIPENARFVRLPEAPKEQVAKLYSNYIAHNPDMPVHAIRLGMVRGKLEHSIVLLVDGQVEGILLWELEGDLGIVHARAVAARYQRSPGWANAALMAEAMSRGWSLGVRRVRFDLPEGNQDTEKLRSRFNAEATMIRDRYELQLPVTDPNQNS